MNVFYLDSDARKSAAYMCDKHIVKMCVESAQMLSTAHRLLDGKELTFEKLHNGKNVKKTLHVFDGENVDFVELELDGKMKHRWIVTNPKCFAVAHAKHPSTIWTMQNRANYMQHFEIFRAMMDEYIVRYQKIRTGLEKMSEEIFSSAPKNITEGPATPPPQAMPEKYKCEDTVEAYRRYYAGDKWKFCKWKHGNLPEWMSIKMAEVWNDDQLYDRLFETIAAGKKASYPMDKRVLMLARELSYEIVSKTIQT